MMKIKNTAIANNGFFNTEVDALLKMVHCSVTMGGSPPQAENVKGAKSKSENEKNVFFLISIILIPVFIFLEIDLKTVKDLSNFITFPFLLNWFQIPERN